MENIQASQSCSSHSSIPYKCFESTCLKSDICRECIFLNKEEILHYYNHYDHIKALQPILNIKHQIKQDECYSDINEVYMEISSEIQVKLNETFSELEKRKENINLMMIKPIFSKYEKLTSTFEILIHELTEKLNDVSLPLKSAKNSILLELNKKIDEHLALLGNKEEIRARLEKILQQSEAWLNKLTVSEILKINSNKIKKKFSFEETLVQVFGNGLGSVEASSEQIANPAKTILKKSEKGDHWNSDKRDLAHVDLFLIENCIIKQIHIGVRCCENITIQGFDENGSLIELMARRQTNLNDDATYSAQRILILNLENDTAVSKVRIICEKGGNVSLFWVEMYGYVLNC